MRHKAEIHSPQLFESRLTNVEFHQTLVTKDFLKNIAQVIKLTQPRITKIPLTRIGKHGDGGVRHSSSLWFKIMS